MEVGRVNTVEKAKWVCSVMMVETLVSARKALACLLLMTGSLVSVTSSLGMTAWEDRFPIEELHKQKHPGPENKDASDTEDDDDEDEDEDGNADQDDDDDVADEDFSGEEGEEEGDPEDEPEANGEGGSDDDDDDDDDEDDGGEDGEDEEEDEEEEEEDEEVPQPPSKRRK